MSYLTENQAIIYRSSEKGIMKKERFASGAPWEEIVGYSRAVKTGPLIQVAGTTATDENGAIVGAGEPHAQAVQCIRNIEMVLVRAGASLADVTRTRIYVTNIDHWEAVGRAHGEFFGAVKPAATLVEVSRLVSPDMLVEIEADAWLEHEGTTDKGE
jgi:enamine deaminase RidA (YjgF/YER057c/UK114 family)